MTTNLLGINTVKDEITIDDQVYSEIDVDTNDSNFQREKDGTEVEMLCNESGRNCAYDSPEIEINEDPISISNMEIEKDVSPTKNLIHCSVCDRNCDSAAHLKEHLSLVHEGKKPIPCGVCNAEFASRAYVKFHIATAHDGKKPFKCEICDSAFFFESSKKRHISMVHDQKRTYACENYSKSFKNQKNLRSHKSEVHDGKKPFKCSDCNISFGIIGDLKKHILSIHEGLMPHICNKCNSGFYTQRGLRRHFNKFHEGKKPSDKNNFKCDFCSSNTIILSEMDLKKHMTIIHGGKKPQCAECKVEFSKDQHLIAHTKKVHGHTNSHSCQICGAKMRKDNLKNHFESVHEKNKQLKCICNVCGKSLGSKLSLKTHISSIHGAPLAERKPWPCAICKKRIYK